MYVSIYQYIHRMRGFSTLNDRNTYIHHLCVPLTLPNIIQSILPFQAASMSCLLLQHGKQSSWELAVLIDSDSQKIPTISFRHLLFIGHNGITLFAMIVSLPHAVAMID